MPIKFRSRALAVFLVALFLVILLVVALLLVRGGYFYSARTTADKTSLSTNYRFVKTSCWFDADWTASITCGEFFTPSSQAEFVLPVVILHNDSEHKRPDPIVYLQGGPGASARLHSEGIKHWLNWVRYANTKRDVILVDTRGTGRSRPALVCEAYNRENQKLLSKNISLADELAQGYRLATECFAQMKLTNPSLDYRNFSTQKSAQDVRALMEELHYPEWNILGVSYGTRLALEIAYQEQQAPHSVRLKAMVLDSIYPAGFGGVQTWPKVLDDAMQQFFQGCSAPASCQEKLLNKTDSLQSQFMEVLAALKEEPLTMSVRRWDGEAPVQFMVNDHRFLSAAFAAVYNPEDWPLIIDAINGVSEHRTEMLKPLVEPYINHSMTSDFNSLTFTAVDCADNPVQDQFEYESALREYPLFQAYTRDQWRYQLCHGLSTEAPLQPNAPHVPTLMLAGVLDPVTPSEWAQAVHKKWSNTQLVLRKHLAHSVLSSDTCLLEHLDDFFDRPSDKFIRCKDGE
jgi:pimeloyl-ACP methyl ester carboxylesterase